MELRKVCCLSVYTGEDVLCGDQPLYKVIARKARELELGGATIVQGKAGFAVTVRGLGPRSHFFSGNYNAPVIVTIIDIREKIEKILPFLEENAAHSLVTLEDTEVLVTNYLREKFKDYVE